MLFVPFEIGPLAPIVCAFQEDVYGCLVHDER